MAVPKRSRSLFGQGFDRLERIVAPPLERILRTGEANYALVQLGRIARIANEQAGRARTRLLHLWELPSHRDVQSLTTQVDQLQRSVEELAEQLEEQERPTR